jgi:hypothetical protein
VLHLDHHRRVHLGELRLVHPALEIRHRGGRRRGGGRARVLGDAAEEGGAQWGYGLTGFATESVSTMCLGHGIREPLLKAPARYAYPYPLPTNKTV